MISRLVSSSPAWDSVLTAQHLEPASDSVSPSLSAPPLPTLCLSKMNKCLKSFFLNNHLLKFPPLNTVTFHMLGVNISSVNLMGDRIQPIINGKHTALVNYRPFTLGWGGSLIRTWFYCGRKFLSIVLYGSWSHLQNILPLSLSCWVHL